MGHEAVTPSGGSVGARGYIQEATETFFGERNPVTAEQVRQAAAGLIALLLLGGLIVAMVL